MRDWEGVDPHHLRKWPQFWILSLLYHSSKLRNDLYSADSLSASWYSHRLSLMLVHVESEVLPRAETSEAGLTFMPSNPQVAGLYMPATIGDRGELLGASGVSAGDFHCY